MGCSHSTADSTRPFRAHSVALPLRPSTPSFHVPNSVRRDVVPTSGAPAHPTTGTDLKDDVPSFVVSNSADLVGSSDGEMVYALVRTFTFSFIQASETSSTHSSLGDMSFTPEEETPPASSSPVVAAAAAAAGGPPPPSSLVTALLSDPVVELPPILEELLGRDGRTTGRAVSGSGTKANASPLSSSTSSETQNGESSGESELDVTDALDAADCSGRPEADHCNATDTRRPVAATTASSGQSALGGPKTEADVRRERRAAARETSSCDAIDDESMRRKVVEADALAIVQEVMRAAVSNVTTAASTQVGHHPQAPVPGRAAPVERSSLQLEPVSATWSLKTPRSRSAPLLNVCAPTYAIVGTSTANGVVWYHVQCTNEEATDCFKWPAALLRRYSRFRAMYWQLKASKLPAADKLPELPPAGLVHFVRGRQSQRTIEERQTQFSSVLHYIATHRELHESAVFQRFLVQ